MSDEIFNDREEYKIRFKDTMEQVSEILGIPASLINRDDYVRITVDCGIEDRITAHTFNMIGGFGAMKELMFPVQPEDITKPKILILDIETAPMLGYCWKMWDNSLGLNQIESDWYVLSWAAKWFGDAPEKTMYMDQRNSENLEDDKEILKELWKLMDEADILVAHNGKKFDIPKLQARFVLNGMKPTSSFKQIDTRILAKRHFAFTSNKLAYLTDKLCTKYKKLDHGKFAGFSMWKECLGRNMEAFEEMEEYNRYDVLSLEELLVKLMPWEDSINFNLYHDYDINICSCGSVNFEKSGFHYTASGKFQKHRCLDCGSEIRDKDNLFSKEKRKSLGSKVRR